MSNISSNFLKLYWGAVINDVLQNVEILTWNNIDFDISRMNKDSLHTLFKIITYRGDESLSKMDSKEVVNYLEDIRVVLADNSYTLQVDQLEWERIMKLIKE